jgi:hypothetical protein
MICKACGSFVNRIDHAVIIEGEVYCREFIEETYGTVGDFIRELIDPFREDN